MTHEKLTHKNLSILVTCATALCILFMGMRVPDISRPHRPKPTHRAFIEKQVKTWQQQAAKKSPELLAAPAKQIEQGTAGFYRTHHLFAFKITGSPPLFPNLSRAPPA